MSFSEKSDRFLTRQYGDGKTSIERDLFLNFKKFVGDGALEEKERALAVIALGTTLHDKAMADFGVELTQSLDLPESHILEAKQSAAIMGMLNTYYKFKSFLAPDVVEQGYARAGLRMQSLSKPENGKAIFEMLAFAVSVVNGCPTCVASHEVALREVSVSTEKIHDLARLASVVKALSALVV